MRNWDGLPGREDVTAPEARILSEQRGKGGEFEFRSTQVVEVARLSRE